MLAFLRGYNMCDGLKKNPCLYEFKNFKTNSATLAMGLWYLVDQTIKQRINLTLERNARGNIFYSLNLLSPNNRIKCGDHLRKPQNEVKKILDVDNYNGWFYDLETTSGEFHCGVGRCHVHNSPRRGEMFVTRKITLGIADILAGKAETLTLGNLDAKRDWGFAPEYVEVMHKMLQQDKSDDYTIGIGETHTVQEFLDEILSYTGLNGEKYLRSDPELFRPTDVRVLKADTTYAQKQLGWKPKIKFHDLAKIMMDSDMRRVGLTPIGEGDKIIAKKFPNKYWIGD
jgi:hypothetical protein